MGYTHILEVNEDAIRAHGISDADAQTIGHAIQVLCLNPERTLGVRGWEEERGADLFSVSPAIFHVDAPHSRDTKIYIWSGNCLRPVHEARLEALEEVARLLATEIDGRRMQGG